MRILLFSKGKTYDVKGCYEENQILLFKGSKIAAIENSYGANRDGVVRANCTKKGNYYILDKDLLFKTPTSAANFCTGRSTNGWVFWKDQNKKLLKDICEHTVVPKPRKKITKGTQSISILKNN
jgi:hypothetical protein